MTLVEIQSNTKPGNEKPGIKYNDNWHSVLGKAANYVDTLQVGDKKEVRENDKGDVIFIGNPGSQKSFAPKEKAVPDTGCNEILDQLDVIKGMLVKIMNKEGIPTGFEQASEY